MKKKIIIILSLLVILLFCFFFHLYLPKLVSQKFSIFIKQKVKIESINFLSFKKIILSNISITLPENKLFFYTKKIIITYNFKIFFKQKNFIKAISKIDFIKPNATIVKNKNGKWNFEFLIKPQEKKPKQKFIISLKQGKIIFIDQEKKFKTKIKNIKGEINLAKNSILFSSQTEDNIQDNIILKGKIDENTLDLNLQISKISLPFYLKYFKLKEISFTKGFANLNLNIFQKKTKIKYQGSFSFENLEGKIEKLKTNFSKINGEIVFKDKNISFSSIYGYLENNFFEIQGECKNDFLKLDFIAKNFDLKNTQKISCLEQEGKGFIKISCLGLLNNLKIKTEFNFHQGKIKKIPFNNLKGNLEYYEKKLNIENFTGNILQGNLDINGFLSFKENNLIFNLQNLNLFSLNEIFPSLKINGLANLSGELKGSQNNPFLKIKLKTHSTKTDIINLDICYQNNDFKINLDYKNYYLVGKITKIFLDKNQIPFEGEFFLTKQKKEIGNFYFNGNFSKKPFFATINLKAEKICFNTFSEITIKTNINLSPQKIIFKNFSISDKIFFASQIDLKTQKILIEKILIPSQSGNIKGKMNISLKEKYIYANLLSTDYKWKNYFLNGNIFLSGKMKNNKLDGILNIKNISINKKDFKPINISFSYDQKILKIKEFCYDTLNCYGNINFIKNPELQISLNMNELDLGNIFSLLNIDFPETKISGKMEILGKLANPSYSCNLTLKNKKINSYCDWINIDFQGSNNLIFLNKINICHKKDYIKIHGKIEKISDFFKIDLSFLTEKYSLKQYNFSTQGIIKGLFFDKLNWQGNLLCTNPEIKNQDQEIKIDTVNFDFKNVNGSQNLNIIFGNLNYKIKELFSFCETLKLTIKKNGKQITGSFIANNLNLNEQKIKNFHTQIKYENSIFDFSSIPNIKGNFLSGQIKLLKEKNTLKKIFLKNVQINGEENLSLFANGFICLNENMDIIINGKNFNISLINWLIPQKNILSGLSSFKIKVQGKQQNPIIEISSYIQNGEVLKIKFSDLELSTIIKNNIIDIKKLDIYNKKNYKIEVNGIIPIGEKNKKEKIDLKIYIPNNFLSVLDASIDEIIKTSCTEKNELKIYINGVINDPKIYGHILISKGNIAFRSFVKPIKNLMLDLVLDENKVYINKLEGNIEKGYFKIVKYQPGPNLILKKTKIEQIAIGIVTDIKNGIKVSIPGYMKKNEWGNIVIHGLEKDKPFIITEHLLEGNLILSKGKFTFPPKFEEKKISTKKNILEEMDINVKMEAGKGLWYQISWPGIEFMCETKGKIEIQKQKKEIKIAGEVKAVPNRGSLKYLNTFFKIKQGQIKFPYYSDGKIEPLLSISAETTIKNIIKKNELEQKIEKFDCNISISIKECNLSQININNLIVNSKPQLDLDDEKNKRKIVSLLTIGEIDASISPNQFFSAFTTLLGEKIENSIIKIEPQLKSFLNIDILQFKIGFIDKLIEKTLENRINNNLKPSIEQNKDFQIIFGKYAGDIYISYKINVENSSLKEKNRQILRKYYQEINIEYDLTTHTLIKWEWINDLGEEKKEKYRIGIEYQETF